MVSYIQNSIASAVTFTSFAIYGRSHFSRKGWIAAMEKDLVRQRLAFLSDVDLSGKVYIVTGANSGCGFEICRYLYYKGATVYMFCRSPERANVAKQLIESDKCFDLMGKCGITSPPEGVTTRSKPDGTIPDDGIATSTGTLSTKATASPSSSQEMTRGNPSPAARQSSRTIQARSSSTKSGSGTGTLIVVPNVDCSSGASIKRAWEEFLEQRLSDTRLDGVVCNAGILNSTSKATFTQQEDGVQMEETLAVHLFYGSYLLAKLSLPLLRKTAGLSGDGPGRLIFMSSGGMLNTSFPNLTTVPFIKEEGKEVPSGFSGNLQYAYAKRGQVLLAERLAAEEMKHSYKGKPRVLVTSCHPGWTDTPGVEKAYGGKKSMLEPLRNLWEGVAGSALWLLAGDKNLIKGGDFYLDFEPQLKHIKSEGSWFSSHTRNTEEEVDMMIRVLDKYTGRYMVE